MISMTNATPQQPARLRMPVGAFGAASAPDHGRPGSKCVYTTIAADVTFVGDAPGVRSWSPPV